MAKFTAIDEASTPPAEAHPAGHAAAGLRAARLLSPDDFRLWLAVLELDDGGELHAGPGGEALYLLDGEVAVDGTVCPAGGAVVVEPGVEARLEARGAVRAAHFGARHAGPVEPGRGVHVVGPRGLWTSGRLEGVEAVWFADSTCPTCAIAFFLVSAADAHRGPPHSHTQDEIIYLIDGSLRTGARRYGPGTALSIHGGTRYALDGPPGGHRFLNFRTGVSYQTNAGQPPRLETAAARDGSYVGDIR
jgi:hypothetical protein